MRDQLIQTIRIPNDFDTTAIDWRKASQCIQALEGRVVVEMFPQPLISGEFILPDKVKEQLRPHLGVVLQSSPSVLQDGYTDQWYAGIAYSGPAPGSIVMCKPGDGTWLEKAQMGEYKPRGNVRVYGVYGEFSGAPQECYWWESILGGYNESMELRPYGNKIFLKRDEAIGTSEGGIYLPDGHFRRSAMATVESVGPFEADVKPGMRVCYDPYHIEQVGIAVGARTDHEMVICSRLSINYVVGE